MWENRGKIAMFLKYEKGIYLVRDLEINYARIQPAFCKFEIFYADFSAERKDISQELI